MMQTHTHMRARARAYTHTDMHTDTHRHAHTPFNEYIIQIDVFESRHQLGNKIHSEHDAHFDILIPTKKLQKIFFQKKL